MIRRTPPRRSRRWLLAVALGVGAALVSSALVGARAATPPHLPYGKIDWLRQTTNGFAVAGWAIDPDSTAPVTVHVYMDKTFEGAVPASMPRQDVAARYHLGANHGFVSAFAAPAGAHTVCIWGINIGAGHGNPRMSCANITLNYDPQGAIASATQIPGGFTATGWAADPSQPTTPLSVAISVDNARTSTVLANQQRNDVGLQPAAGKAHGFTITTSATEGTHRVCLAITNVGLGNDVVVSCRSITLNFSPVGAITTVNQTPGGFHIAGWAQDPDTGAAVTVNIFNGATKLGSATANLNNVGGHAGHGFDTTLALTDNPIAPGVRNLCAQGVNLGQFGSTRNVACRAINLNYNPSAGVYSINQRTPGARLIGWGVDPDTGSPVKVDISADGKAVTTVTANLPGHSDHPGHYFDVSVPLPNGTHKLCAVTENAAFGNGNSAPACATVSLNFNPFGHLDSATRVARSTNISVSGWASDPDTSGPIHVAVTIDGKAMSPQATTTMARPDVVKARPGVSANTGFSIAYPANDGEHKVCVTAVNYGGGNANTALGCSIVNAVHPKPPSAPLSVTATGGYGGATVTWSPPASDGGAPWTYYVVSASSGPSIHVAASATSATLIGLLPGRPYVFYVSAVNVAGSSPTAFSNKIHTQTSPPPQTTPAPISTSRYIRNVTGASSHDLATMQAEGAADARANPSGHGYLILLDIGGQDQADGGVVLSATTQFVSYGDLVKDVNAYVDGYASAQKPSAPVIIAIGTNNDMDVSAGSGATWAKTVVGPVVGHASRYTGVTIAGANDIEPGFRGTYAQTKTWLQGYLGGTTAPFVNNGSADGCAWTQPNMGCNNGWNMSGLYYLSAGAAPVRIINLPQVYNNTMAQQWRFISLTGVNQRSPRINFGGALTEWTACAQSGGCGSLTGNAAWTQLWNQLQSTPALKVGSLPYSTDLRIDR